MQVSRRLWTGLFALLLMVACCARCPAKDAPGEEVLTEHYSLYVEGADGRALGNLLEQSHAELKRFFGSEPHELLRVKVFADKERYAGAVVAGNAPGERAEQATGIYDWKNKTVYVTNETRSILHEAAHQFHNLARTKNRIPRSRYYGEGLARHLECFRFSRDGKLSIGVIPDVAFPDYPALALSDCMDRPKRSLRDTATDTGSPHTWNELGRAWGLVSFLLSEHHAQYLIWSAALDDQADPAEAWDKAFGGQSEEQLNREYLDWLKKHQMPWSATPGDWQSTDERSLTGYTYFGSMSAAVLKRSITSLTVSVNPQPVATAGIVIDYESPTTYRVVQVSRSGRVWLAALVNNQIVSNTIVPGVQVRNPRQFDVKVLNQNGLTKVFIDNVPVVELKIPEGRKTGLEVSNGLVTFCDIKAE